MYRINPFILRLLYIYNRTDCVTDFSAALLTLINATNQIQIKSKTHCQVNYKYTNTLIYCHAK